MATSSGAANDDPRSDGADRTNDVDDIDDTVEGGDERDDNHDDDDRDIGDDGERGAGLSSRASPNGAGGASRSRSLLHRTHLLDSERGRSKSFETRPRYYEGPGNGAFFVASQSSRGRELPGGQRPLEVTASAGIVAVVEEIVSRCVIDELAELSGASLALDERGRIRVA